MITITLYSWSGWMIFFHKQSPFCQDISKPSYCPVFDKTNMGWEKKRNLEKKENKLLMKRFLNSKSFYLTESFKSQNYFNSYFEKTWVKGQLVQIFTLIPFQHLKRNFINNLLHHHSTVTSDSLLSRSRKSIFNPYFFNHSINSNC